MRVMAMTLMVMTKNACNGNIQTIGCDFFENTVMIRNQRIQMSVWDIGGQSVASKNLPNYLSGATLVFVVYDVTNSDSFRDVVNALWLRGC